MDKGYSNLKVLKGGYDAWKEAGYPMETGAPQEVLMIVPAGVSAIDASKDSNQEYMLINLQGQGGVYVRFK